MTIPESSPTSSYGSGGGGLGAASKNRQIEDELNRLRERGNVKTQRGKYKSADVAGLMTPEEAQEYLAAQRAAQSRKSKQAPTPPANMASADLDSWYLQQRKREVEERRKREEAERILRGYKGHYVHPNDTNRRAAGGGKGAEGAVAGVGEIDGNSIDARGFFRDAESGAASGGASWVPVFPKAEWDEAGGGGASDSKRASSDDVIVGLESLKVSPSKSEGGGDASDGAESGPKGSETSAADTATATATVTGTEENVTGDKELMSDGSNCAETGGSGTKLLDADDVTEATVSTGAQVLDTLAYKKAGAAKANDPDKPSFADFDMEATELHEEKKIEDYNDTSPCAPTEVPPAAISMPENFISSADGAFYQPEKDRYHLVVSLACPWSHRALLVRALKGLQDVVSVTTVYPIWQRTKPDDPDDEHRGWIFGDPTGVERGDTFTNTSGHGGPFPTAFKGNDPDPIMGAFSVRDLYEKAGDKSGKFTVPVLWDKKTGTIVSTESSDIMRMLNSSFDDFASNPSLDLYPEHLRNDIDAVNSWVYPTLNNGVYRCGFATTQAAYNLAIGELTRSFDRVETLLKKQRFLLGDVLTEADLRLFVTMLRFDEVYSVYFKTNTRSVSTSPAILNHCRTIYNMPGVAETCDMEQIKYHYFCSHVEVSKFSIVPQGPDFMRLLEQNE